MAGIGPVVGTSKLNLSDNSLAQLWDTSLINAGVEAPAAAAAAAFPGLTNTLTALGYSEAAGGAIAAVGPPATGSAAVRIAAGAGARTTISATTRTFITTWAAFVLAAVPMPAAGAPAPAPAVTNIAEYNKARVMIAYNKLNTLLPEIAPAAIGAAGAGPAGALPAGNPVIADAAAGAPAAGAETTTAAADQLTAALGQAPADVYAANVHASAVAGARDRGAAALIAGTNAWIAFKNLGYPQEVVEQWTIVRELAIWHGIAGIDHSSWTGAAAIVPDAENRKQINIQVLSHILYQGASIAYSTQIGNLIAILNQRGGVPAPSFMGNYSNNNLYNILVAKLGDNIDTLQGFIGEDLRTFISSKFTGSPASLKRLTAVPISVNPNSDFSFDSLLSPQALAFVLDNRQKKLFKMAPLNIQSSWNGIFGNYGNSLKFQLVGGGSLDPNVPIEMRGHGKFVYGSPLKGGMGDNNWQIVPENAYLSAKLKFVLDDAISKLGPKLTPTAQTSILDLHRRLVQAEKEAKERAEQLKTVISMNSNGGLTKNITNDADLKSASEEYNNSIGRVAKLERKLGNVTLTLVRNL
jgi:hypothetical protein